VGLHSGGSAGGMPRSELATTGHGRDWIPKIRARGGEPVIGRSPSG
jgi:hypothetical protein